MDVLPRLSILNMDLPAVIDVAIGLVVFYCLLSTLCSFAVELVATWRWWRKRWLYETIGRLITGELTRKTPVPPLLPDFRTASRRQPKEDASLISPGDLDAPAALVETLKDRGNPVAEFLQSQFDAKAWTSITQLAAEPRLNNRRPQELRKQLAQELNRAIASGSIHDPARCIHVALSQETRSLLAKDATPEVTRRLNRSVLEDAFPNHFCKEVKHTDEVLAKFWEHPLARALASDWSSPICG